MVGLGTIINTLAILIGGLLGLLLGRLLKPTVQDALTKACGVSTIFIAIFGAVEKMRMVPDGGAMLIVICMTLGTLIGELLGIERIFERFGVWLKKKTGSSRDNGFVEAFVTASFTVCIGAMAIVGSIQDGLLGDYTVLATKAVLDLVIIMAMTASLGKGAVFSAIPVAVLQGSVTLLAGLLKGIMTDGAMTNLSLIGNILIFCVGVNLLFGKKVKVANMLPAILAAVAAAFLPI